MNLGAIWDKLDEMDRKLLDMVLHINGSNDVYHRSKYYHKLIFTSLHNTLIDLKRNIVYCDNNEYYSIIDDELFRTKKIIRLIEEVL